MAFIRAILYYLNIAICLFVIGLPYMFYRGVLCRRWADSTRVCIPFFNTTFKLFGIKVEIEGKENIPDHKQFVIVANHQSFLDINVLWPTITITSFIAKAELWKIPVFGWVLNGHMLPFQNGIFRMAKENKFPLLPVTIVDSGKRLSKTKWAMTPGVVKIVVHPLQTPESFENKSATQLRDEIHNMISSSLPYRQDAQQEA